ncbi:FG-GAP repeat protein, partial [bacterium]|nr:FG-GAP repeat protein [bacterium]
MNGIFTILFLTTMLLVNSAKAQITETKLTASEGLQFGGSVSLAGDIAIVGVSLMNANAAYSFRLDGADWVELGMLVPNDGVAAEAFGSSVATTDSFAIIGAPLFDHPTATNGGAAYLFKREGETWTEQIRIAPSDVDGQDDSGTSVAISGDYAIVGSPNHNDNGLNSGAAYIFKRSGDSWVEQAKLLASDGAQDDEFGFSVSISGDYAIVGSWQDDDKGGGSGSAYVFHRNDTTWVEQVKLTASDGTPGASFGISVSISGDYALIGAPVANGNVAISGAAYVFKWDGENWVEQDKLAASDGVSSDFFGGSVSIDGDFAIVGAFNSAGIVDDAGSAYVFRGQDTNWTEIAKITASDGAAFDLFGTSVSISGDCAIVGAEADENAAGSAYAYCGLSTV